MTIETRRIFHITAGDKNWTPSDTELDIICASFKKAVVESPGKDGVVVTRNSVNVSIHEIPVDAQFIVAKAKPEATE